MVHQGSPQFAMTHWAHAAQGPSLEIKFGSMGAPAQSAAAACLGPVSDLSGSARGSAGLVQLAWFARGGGARSCCGVGRPCSTGGFSGAGLALQKEHALGHTHNKVGVRV